MRIFLFLLPLLFVHSVNAQDKKLLEKQMLQIMTDFPNKFKNLTEQDGKTLKFNITGTVGNTLVMNYADYDYLTSGLSSIKSEQEAKALFDKWVNLINSLDLNGAPLKSSDCKEGRDFCYLCRKWKFNDSKFSMDSKYKSFTILLEIALFEGTYAGSLKIGSGDL